jgi:Glyoxalase-like domain
MAEAIGQLSGIVLECPDPAALARFYADLTGSAVGGSDDEWAWLDSGGQRAQLCFQRAPGYRAPVWPDPTSSMQSHLDFHVSDLDAAERAALQLGATKFDEQPSPSNFRVMADPVGHPFCLCIN